MAEQWVTDGHIAIISHGGQEEECSDIKDQKAAYPDTTREGNILATREKPKYHFWDYDSDSTIPSFSLCISSACSFIYSSILSSTVIFLRIEKANVEGILSNRLLNTRCRLQYN